MSKKSILNTLLISSALLGATVASAATSDIKSESKKVTVSTEKAKLYKDSKLKESTTPKNGTVYQVNGYRDINGKHVYRVYQTDKNGKQVYRGYIDKKDAKDFNGQKASGQYVAKKGSSFWANFYWTEKKASLSEDKVVFAKYEYTLGNGQKYYSMYTKDAAGKDVWQGYTTKSNLSDVKSTVESKYITLNKNTKSFANLYFQQTKGNFDASKGVNFKVTRYYTIGGKKYYSTEQNNGWTGYVDASVVSDLKAEKVADADSKVQVVKEWNTYSNHFYTKKDQLKDYKGKTLTQKYIYTYGNGKKYASLYDGDTWLGYANVEALKVVENKPKPEAPKPTEDEVKALEDAVEKAKKVVAAENNLNGVEPVKQALEKAEKILKDENKTQKDVVDATKAINDAIKGITLKPSQNEEAIKALHAAIEQLKETQKLGADNLVNNQDYQKVLTSAEKVLEDAVNGKTDKNTIEAETKKVNDFINGLKLNTEALKQKIEAVKAKGDKVYMNQEQETKFNKFIEDAKTAASNDKLSNTDKLKEIDAQLKQAEDFIKGQPTETDVQKLIDATKKEQEVASQLKGKEDQIFQNWNDVKTKDETADTMLTEIKKDQSPSNNTADKKYTAKDVQDAAKELMGSMANLEVNHENLEKYDTAAKDAINDLDEAHKEVAQNLLTSFEVAAENASVKDLTQMVNAAKSLNKEIHDDQVEEINSVIEKAKRIEGVSDAKEQGTTAPNAKFYETSSYNDMNSALGAAEKAEQALKGETVTSRSKRSADAGTTQVQNGKNAAQKEKELKEKIDALQVKDWQTKEVDGKLQLVKYTGDYTKSTDRSRQSKDGSIVIEVPGSLKDEQVVLGNTNSDKIFPAPSQNNGNGQVELRFEENSNRKVQTNGNMNAAMANNKSIGVVDFTGLDTSNVTTFDGLFLNDFNLKEVKGEENLVSSKATDLSTMFCNTKVSTLNTSGWNTSNVTDMERMFNKSGIQTIIGLEHWNVENVTKFQNMFGGTDKLKTLNLSGWSMEKANTSNTGNMFISKDGSLESQINKVILPDANNGKVGQGPKLVVEALIKAEGQSGGLSHDVEVLCAVNSTSPEKIGIVKYVGSKPDSDHGEWQGEGQYAKENIITTDSKILNDPVALCRVVMDSEGSTETDKAAKNLAKLLDKVAYPVWTYSTGHKVIKSRDKGNTVLVDSGENDVNNQGINNNASWSSFEKNGSGHYYKAIKLLQDYAQNKTSVEEYQANDMMDALIGDFQGMQVITEDLQDLVAQAKARKEDSKAMVSLIEKAQDCIEHPKLDNWKNIVETTKELREAIKESQLTQKPTTEQKGDVITKDQATLKSAPALARAILTSDKTSKDAKELAEVVKAAYEVDKNSTGDYEKSISKVDINKSWTEFGGSGNGSYYDALKDLQDYARNTASVSDEKLQKAEAELVDDMEGLRVLPDYLDAAMKEAQKAEKVAKAKNVEVESTEQLIQDAKVIVEGKNDARRGLDNWKHINELTAKLKEAAKKLTTIVKK